MKGPRNLAWTGHDGVRHGFRETERGRSPPFQRWGTTLCGIGLNLTFQTLRRADPDCIACIAARTSVG